MKARWPHISIDLETLDNVPGGVILSIGAVCFDPERDALGPEFYEVINQQSCVDAGLSISSDTLAWWKQQSEDAQCVLLESRLPTTPTLRDVLEKFNGWIEHDCEPRHVKVWGNGSDFDNAFLARAYRQVGLDHAWKFWNNESLRTARSAYGRYYVMEWARREGLHHNALDDAKHQARIAMKHVRHQWELQSMWSTGHTARTHGGTLYNVDLGVYVTREDPHKATDQLADVAKAAERAKALPPADDKAES